MKRTIIHTSAAIALLLGIAACTQDEAGFLQEGAEGTPIVFTATGLNPLRQPSPIPVPPWTATGRVCRAWQS